MPRYKVLVQKIQEEKAFLLFEDGFLLPFPLSKLPEGTQEGAFLKVSISPDRITALLHHINKRQLIPKQAKS